MLYVEGFHGFALRFLTKYQVFRGEVCDLEHLLPLVWVKFHFIVAELFQ